MRGHHSWVVKIVSGLLRGVRIIFGLLAKNKYRKQQTGTAFLSLEERINELCKVIKDPEDLANTRIFIFRTSGRKKNTENAKSSDSRGLYLVRKEKQVKRKTEEFSRYDIGNAKYYGKSGVRKFASN